MLIVAISINLTALGEIPKWFFERIQIHGRWVYGAWFTRNSLLWNVDDPLLLLIVAQWLGISKKIWVNLDQ